MAGKGIIHDIINVGKNSKKLSALHKGSTGINAVRTGMDFLGSDHAKNLIERVHGKINGMAEHSDRLSNFMENHGNGVMDKVKKVQHTVATHPIVDDVRLGHNVADIGLDTAKSNLEQSVKRGNLGRAAVGAGAVGIGAGLMSSPSREKKASVNFYRSEIEKTAGLGSIWGAVKSVGSMGKNLYKGFKADGALQTMENAGSKIKQGWNDMKAVRPLKQEFQESANGLKTMEGNIAKAKTDGLGETHINGLQSEFDAAKVKHDALGQQIQDHAGTQFGTKLKQVGGVAGAGLMGMQMMNNNNNQ